MCKCYKLVKLNTVVNANKEGRNEEWKEGKPNL